MALPKVLVFAYWLCLITSTGTGVRAQTDDFFVNGDAIQLNDSCFRLTQAGDTFAVGSIWWPEKIDLRNSFDLVMTMNFGCEDVRGADGMVFGLQPVSASVGEAGEGLGIGGISPALGVEFDTYQNTVGVSRVDRFDPPFDHVALMANGAVTHAGPDNLAGPVQASASSPNIETCRPLPLRVTWDAPAMTLRVYLDCELRIEYTGDIINDIFGGDPRVFYGFAGATGGLTNTQEVCFTFNSFRKQLSDVTICPGAKALFDVTGGARYEWSPARGLSSTTAPSVEASPDSTTVYTVKIFDDCDLPLLDTARVTVAGDSAFVDLGPDTTLCPGQVLDFDITVPTAVYDWSDSTLSGPRVTIADPGTYTVTATRTDIICTASDRVEVSAYDVPVFDIAPRDTQLCLGDSLLVAAVFPVGTALTAAGEPFDTLAVRGNGRYEFTFDHPCGVQTDAVDVSLSSCREYFVPTAFSPDNNGRNDVLRPYDDGDIVTVHRFAVYNRWGGLVYESDELPPDERPRWWDGTISGQPAPPDTYLWVMDATFRSGERGTDRGVTVLVR